MEKTGLGQVRIIAGTLRGSKLSVLNEPGLRPSSDRVRETLFNWLQNKIQGSRVLDLFAGTGVLGFEAVSRNALHVIMLERNVAACALLESNKKRLKIENLEVVQQDCMLWLQNTAQSGFDLVFLDPPYATQYWAELWPLLLPKLSSNALIYIEISQNGDCLLPAQLVVLKHGKTQQSNYFLTQLKNATID